MLAARTPLACCAVRPAVALARARALHAIHALDPSTTPCALLFTTASASLPSCTSLLLLPLLLLLLLLPRAS